MLINQSRTICPCSLQLLAICNGTLWWWWSLFVCFLFTFNPESICLIRFSSPLFLLDTRLFCLKWTCCNERRDDDKSKARQSKNIYYIHFPLVLFLGSTLRLIFRIAYTFDAGVYYRNIWPLNSSLLSGSQLRLWHCVLASILNQFNFISWNVLQIKMQKNGAMVID